jgi:osmoprotectant transport system substrate-binding protein
MAGAASATTVKVQHGSETRTKYEELPVKSDRQYRCRRAQRSWRFGERALGLGLRYWSSLLSILAVATLLSSCSPAHSDQVVIGSKNFTESLILGELMAQQIEAQTSLKVERRFYLAGTYICHQAMLAGRIDIYPEYTGTALSAILQQKPEGGRAEVYQLVKDEYQKRFGLTLEPSFGFNDTFAMEIRGEDARRLNIRTLSQAAAYAVQWHAGFGYEFMERPDGYQGLAATYGLHFAAPPQVMDLGLLVRALRDHQIDLAAGNTTDGLIGALDFFVLEDDRHYFPPYEAVPVVRERTLQQHPEVVQALVGLEGKISDREMQQLNYAVDGLHRDVKEVARDFLRKKMLVK